MTAPPAEEVPLSERMLVGSLEPRVCVWPQAPKSAGRAAVDLARHAGLRLDPWQCLALERALGIEDDGRWAAFEAGLIVARQNGKALATDTPLLTANRGWVTMAGIRVGDEVFHPGGHATVVTHVHEVMTDRDCYRVTTTDGRTVVADADHLWTVIDKRRSSRRGGRRVFAVRTLTTREMAEEGLSRIASGRRATAFDGKVYATNEFRFALPVQEPLKSTDVDLPVDPYLFGAWLGDGDSAGARLTCDDGDVEHWRAAIADAGFIATDCYSQNARILGITTEPGPGRHGRSFGGHLRRLGVLGDKHVPDLYLTAGTGQREALLQGLMDTDGTIGVRRGQAEFCSTNRRLAEAVLFLARSLGWRATLDGRDCGPKYRVCWTPTRQDPFTPVRMPRKAERIRQEDGGKGRSTVSVASIEPVASVPVRCITVASPDGLYLAGRDLVATHNSAIFEARMLAGMFLLHEELILYSAHEFKTAGEIFRRVLALIEGTPDLRKRVKAVARSKGEEGIELLPTRQCPRGQRLRFVARSTNSGRGFSADCTIWDECQNLPDASVDAMMPTLLARPNPQLWYGGSAPDKDLAPCEQITRVRARALGGDTARLAYFEWSAELCGDMCSPNCTEHDDPASPLTWAKTNPALGSGRVTVEGIAKMHASMSYRGFARELLSVGNYPVESGGWDVVSEAAWEATQDAASQPVDPVAFAIDVTPDRSMACIAIAGVRGDGLTHLEVVDHEPGTGWVVDRVVELVERWRPCAVAVDPGGPAGSLVDALEAEQVAAVFEHAGTELAKPRARDVAGACGALFDAVVRPPDAPEGWASSVRHIPHPGLSSALSGAGKRPLGDAWAWDRRGVSVDISPLVAVTLARWAQIKHGADGADYDVTMSVY